MKNTLILVFLLISHQAISQTPQKTVYIAKFGIYDDNYMKNGDADKLPFGMGALVNGQTKALKQSGGKPSYQAFYEDPDLTDSLFTLLTQAIQKQFPESKIVFENKLLTGFDALKKAKKPEQVTEGDVWIDVAGLLTQTDKTTFQNATTTIEFTTKVFDEKGKTIYKNKTRVKCALIRQEGNHTAQLLLNQQQYGIVLTEAIQNIFTTDFNSEKQFEIGAELGFDTFYANSKFYPCRFELPTLFFDFGVVMLGDDREIYKWEVIPSLWKPTIDVGNEIGFSAKSSSAKITEKYTGAKYKIRYSKVRTRVLGVQTKRELQAQILSDQDGLIGSTHNIAGDIDGSTVLGSLMNANSSMDSYEVTIEKTTYRIFYDNAFKGQTCKVFEGDELVCVIESYKRRLGKITVNKAFDQPKTNEIILAYLSTKVLY